MELSCVCLDIFASWLGNSSVIENPAFPCSQVSYRERMGLSTKVLRVLGHKRIGAIVGDNTHYRQGKARIMTDLSHCIVCSMCPLLSVSVTLLKAK